MWRVRVCAVILLAGLVAGCGTEETPGPDTEADTEDAAPALFVSTVVHDIEVDVDTEDYEAMLATFADTGDKEWIEATVTIDGATYEQAGLRLKGNSSLMGLRGQSDDDEEREDPNTLPWLIRLNAFVDGQDHQGFEDVVIRSNGSATALNEAVALELLEAALLPSQQAAPASFSVNGADPVLRLAIEHPDDDAWQEANFPYDGALYKAESTGDWSYRGDDPAAYEEVFDQEGGSDHTDLTPLIEFLEFINESDDETFAAELPERLDVEAFATYLAMMEIVDNFDDIDGPGNNAYLWYDLPTEQFTVVPWDMNLAFGSFGAGGGGPGGFDPGQIPGGGELPEGFDPSQIPGGGELPEGFDPSQIPDDLELPEGFDPSQIPGGVEGVPGGPFGGSNVLVERFHDNEEFESLYEEKLVTLREVLYGSDVATEILDRWVETLTESASDLVSPETVQEEADAIAEQFTT